MEIPQCGYVLLAWALLAAVCVISYFYIPLHAARRAMAAVVGIFNITAILPQTIAGHSKATLPPSSQGRQKKVNKRNDKGKERYILRQTRPATLSLALHLTLLLSPFLPPRSQRDRSSHPRAPQEGQHHRSRSWVLEHGPHRRGHRPSLLGAK